MGYADVTNIEVTERMGFHSRKQLLGQTCWRVGLLVCVLVASMGIGGMVNDAAAQRQGKKKRFRKQPTAAVLTSAEVTDIIQAAAEAISETTMSVAVADRTGQILGVFRKPDSDADTDELAVALARTAAFFSHNQAPLSSRTVRFISGIHFPNTFKFSPQSDLYGIDLSNRGCPLSPDLEMKGFEPSRSIDGTQPGLGIITGKADLFDSDPNAVNPGGVPIYKNGEMVGGVGVAGVRSDLSEFAALTASQALPGSGIGFFVNKRRFGTSSLADVVVFVGGIALPFVNTTTRPAGSSPGDFVGNFVVAPRNGRPAPDGWLVGPLDGNGLSASEVERIVNQSRAAAERTRAVIRLPIGSRVRMVIAVGDLDGKIVGVFRQPDSTTFSIDVACTKARNVVYFSTPQGNVELNLFSNGEFPLRTDGRAWAITNRTLNFGAQPLYPPGIDGTNPGPFFDLFAFDAANPCTQALGGFPDPTRNSGIVFFPGSVPLYKNGQLVGGLGISGDGVDQDDYVAGRGAQGFEPPFELRADNITIRGVRLPYLKFPRNPEA